MFLNHLICIVFKLKKRQKLSVISSLDKSKCDVAEKCYDYWNAVQYFRKVVRNRSEYNIFFSSN